MKISRVLHAVAESRLVEPTHCCARRWKMMQTAKTTSPSMPLARKDRIALFLEYAGNKWLRNIFTSLYRRMNGRPAPRTRNVLLLTTRGRKSGKDRTVILQFFPDGATMVVVAANSGRPANPDWFYNLMANPIAWVEIRDRALVVRAEPVLADDAATFWPRILQRAPTYERYRKATERVIPLVRLIPMDEVARTQAPSS